MREELKQRWVDRESDCAYFPEQYFAGTDVSIYINDREVADIAAISFELRQQLRPIYGYNSYVLDRMAIGNRIVIGTIRIPFVRKNYLKSLFKPSVSSGTTDAAVPFEGEAGEKTREYLKRRFGYGDDIKIQGSEISRRQYSPGYFGEGFTKEQSAYLQKHGFNIYIAYGKQTVEEIANIYKTQSFSLNDNIDIVLNKGINMIEGAFIRGHGQTVEINDTIYEVYEFLAKDVY